MINLKDVLLQKPVSLGMPFALNFADFFSKNHFRNPSLGFELLKLVVVVELSRREALKGARTC